MYLQEKRKQSTVMNSVPQEPNLGTHTSRFPFPPLLPTALPPPNPNYSPFQSFNSNTFNPVITFNPVTSPFYIPPFPPPNFPNNKPLAYENVNQFQCKVPDPYIDHEDANIEATVNFGENSFIEKDKTVNGDLWLSNWLSKVNGRRAKNIASQNVKISEAKEILKSSIFLLKNLDELKQKMEKDYVKMSNSLWNSMCCDFKKIEKNVVNLLSKLPDVRALKIAITKRSKKRKCQKRRKKEIKDQKAQDIERRQQLHHQIDTWMKSMQENIESNKREVSLKKEADSVLSEVLRKKADGRRQLALVTALLKLRQLRAKSVANRGQHISIENGIKFSKVAENLKSLWEKQLKEYDVEENGMRVMLSEAIDERDHSQVLRDRQVFSEWNKLLFGNSSADIPEFFDGANRNIESFVRIRQAWDKFVVHSKMSVQSSIPIGWVLPSNPSSTWEKLLV